MEAKKSIKSHQKPHMTQIKPIRESLSFKQQEKYIVNSRDELCRHYKLNKSDLVKYLIKKESFNLRNPQGTLISP